MRVRHPVYLACLNKDVLIKLWVCQNQNTKKKNGCLLEGGILSVLGKKKAFWGGTCICVGRQICDKEKNCAEKQNMKIEYGGWREV